MLLPAGTIKKNTPLSGWFPSFHCHLFRVLIFSIIRLDVGGTSTDVSRFDGRYEVVYETTTAGVTIQSPQLDINTVAAGGGSCLNFRNGLFLTGPESAGAQPGPACYRLVGTRLFPYIITHIFSGKVGHWLSQTPI